jgi:fluoride ion exporter CrcB/FEX
MADRPDILSWLWTEPGRAVLAGAMGGIVRWVTLRQNWRDGLVSLLVGAICANYLGPLAVPILTPLVDKLSPGKDAVGLISFAVGIGGISISGMLIDLFRARRRQAADDADAK